MKRNLIALAAAALLLTGCSSKAPAESTAETLPALTEPPEPALVYLIDDHGAVSPAETSQFTAELEAQGYVVQSGTFAALPTGADAVILNSPREDITPEEQAQLERYMQDGGHLLFLMPADESETRYKYIERFLEPWCILMDYDLLTETDPNRMQGDDPTFLHINQISAPDGMTITQETADTPLYLHHARSFRFVYQENYTDIRQDTMWETWTTTVGEPCGGDFDDPDTFTDELLMTMVYSRDTSKHNAFVICVGASDFLLDANYSADTSAAAKAYMFAGLSWAANPTGF